MIAIGVCVWDDRDWVPAILLYGMVKGLADRVLRRVSWIGY